MSLEDLNQNTGHNSYHHKVDVAVRTCFVRIDTALPNSGSDTDYKVGSELHTHNP